MDNYAVIYEFPDDLRMEFSHIYFDPPGFSGIKERVYGAKGAIDLATATWIEREKKGEIQLDVPNAAEDPTYLSLAGVYRQRTRPQEPAEQCGVGRNVDHGRDAGPQSDL